MPPPISGLVGLLMRNRNSDAVQAPTYTYAHGKDAPPPELTEDSLCELVARLLMALNAIYLAPFAVISATALVIGEFGWAVAIAAAGAPNVLNIATLGSRPERTWLHTFAALGNLVWIGLAVSMLVPDWCPESIVYYTLMAGLHSAMLPFQVFRLIRGGSSPWQRLFARIKSTTLS